MVWYGGTIYLSQKFDVQVKFAAIHRLVNAVRRIVIANDLAANVGRMGDYTYLLRKGRGGMNLALATFLGAARPLERGRAAVLADGAAAPLPYSRTMTTRSTLVCPAPESRAK
jgi:hypothetical protein